MTAAALDNATIPEDDELLASLLTHANIPALIMSIVHLTGDTARLDAPIRPPRTLPGSVEGGLSEEDKTTVRAMALQALRDYRDRGRTLPAPPSRSTIRRMLSFAVGDGVSDEYVPMFLEEMALETGDARDVRWDDVPLDRREGFHVVIIGAGTGCLALLLRDGFAAMECRQDVYDRYAARFDARHTQLMWSHPGMNSWYKNANGRVLTTSPWRLVDYWSWTRTPTRDDYELRR